MKQLLAGIVLVVCFCQCTPKKQYLTFENLSANEFDAGGMVLPGGKNIDSVKHAHDSCMGIAFDANVMLVNSKDSLFVGNIVNRRSLKIVGSLKDVGADFMKLATQYNIVANPCYEKRELHVPLKLMLAGKLPIQLPGADAAVNAELNGILAASQNQELQTGSWMYLDMNQVLINMMDTIQSLAGLQYREKLLDTANMFLSAIESISRISFLISSQQILSPSLRAKLSEKPSVMMPGSRFPIQFHLIGPYQFQLSTDGFFPVVGKFMKGVLKKE